MDSACICFLTRFFVIFILRRTLPRPRACKCYERSRGRFVYLWRLRYVSAKKFFGASQSRCDFTSNNDVDMADRRYLIGFGMFWPLVWHLSLNILVRIGILAYLLFEAWEAYREKSPQSSVRAHESIGLKIIGAIVVAFGLVIIGGGLWLADSEWSKVAKWPRTIGVLVDKKIFRGGARLIFEYEVTGGRSAGRVDRYGQEEEIRTFLEPYRVGASYPIGYNPENAPEVEFHLGYNWDLFRVPIAVMMFGSLFAVAGLVVGSPWRRAPRG